MQELPHGHLVPYPVSIAQDGTISPLSGHVCFPDTKAAVLGKTMKVPRFLRSVAHILTT